MLDENSPASGDIGGIFHGFRFAGSRAQSESEISDLKARIEALEKKGEGSSSQGASSWTDKIKFGVHLRIRNEGRFNYDRNSDVGDKDDFTLLRARLSADANPSEKVRAFIQFQASRVFGDSCLGAQPPSSCLTSSSYSPFNPGNLALGVIADDEDLTVHQAFVDLKFLGDFTARLGRQEMLFGDERLVGALAWSNRTRAFDGFSLIHDTEAHRAQAFFHVIEYRPPSFTTAPLDNDSFFTGFYNTFKEIGKGVDYYFLAFLDGDGAVPTTQDENLFIYTFGLRTKDMPKEGLGYDFEGAFQAGENDAVKIYAYAVHVAGGYGLGGELAPYVTLEYNVASGEDGIGNDNAFKNLFPTNHCKYGCIDFMTWSNTHNFRGGVSVVPVDALTVALDYRLFLSQEKTGKIGILTAAGASTTPVADRFYGQELDVVLNYAFDKYAKLHGGYSLFLPGDMFPATNDDAVHFAYAQVQVDVQ